MNNIYPGSVPQETSSLLLFPVFLSVSQKMAQQNKMENLRPAIWDQNEHKTCPLISLGDGSHSAPHQFQPLQMHMSMETSTEYTNCMPPRVYTVTSRAPSTPNTIQKVVIPHCLGNNYMEKVCTCLVKMQQSQVFKYFHLQLVKPLVIEHVDMKGYLLAFSIHKYTAVLVERSQNIQTVKSLISRICGQDDNKQQEKCYQ